MVIYSMKITATALLVFAGMSLIVVNPLTLGSIYALKGEDGRYIILTLENVKSRDVEATAYIYNEDEDKKIKGSPGPIDETAAQVKHTFHFDNDDFPTDAGPGTQFIVCIEFKNGKGEVSCWTDTFKSESQPSRITLDADYIRDD